MASKKKNIKNKAFLKFQYNMARIRRKKAAINEELNKKASGLAQERREIIANQKKKPQQLKEQSKYTPKEQKRLDVRQQSVMKDVSKRLFGDTTSEEYQKSSFLDQVGQEREKFLYDLPVPSTKEEVAESLKKPKLSDSEYLQKYKMVHGISDFSKADEKKILQDRKFWGFNYPIKPKETKGISKAVEPVGRAMIGLKEELMLKPSPSKLELSKFGYNDKTGIDLPVLGRTDPATSIGQLVSYVTPMSMSNLIYKSGGKAVGKLTAKTALGKSQKLFPKITNATIKNITGTGLSELERSTRNYVQGELDLTGENISQSAKEWAINTAIGVAFNAAIEGGVTGVKGLANKVKAKKITPTRTTELIGDETISTSGSKKKRPDYVTTVDEANVKTLKRPGDVRIPRIQKTKKLIDKRTGRKVSSTKKEMTKIPSQKEIKFGKQQYELNKKTSEMLKAQKSKGKSKLTSEKVKETKPLTLEERTTKQQSKEYTTKIPEKVLKSKEEFDKYYGLDKDITKSDQIKTITKIQEDIGSRSLLKSGAKNLNEYVGYIKSKYKLPYDFKINKTLRSDKSFARLPVKNYQKGDVVTIKVNPNKSINQQVGAIRHELEHLIDYNKSGKYGKDITSVGGTFRQSYGGKGHHLQYDFFEPDYLRKAMLKDLQKGRLKITGEKVEAVETPKMEQKTVTTTETKKTTSQTKKTTTQQKVIDKKKAKKSKHFQTVKDAPQTRENFRKHLDEKVKAPEYETFNMEESWQSAKKRLEGKSPDELFGEYKGKKAYNNKDSADMMVLHDYYASKGNHEKAAEVLIDLSKKATASGQFIKMLHKWKLQTTEGLLKYTQQKQIKNVENTRYFKKSDVLKREISDLRNIINNLKKNPKTNKNEIELNSRILDSKKKQLSKLDKLVNKSMEEMKKRSIEDSKYIKEHFENYKSDKFYESKYKERLNQITEGKTPTAKQIEKATNYAQRQKDIELSRTMQRIKDVEGVGGRDLFRGVQRMLLLSSPSSGLMNFTANTLFHATDIWVRENFITPGLDYLTSAARTKSLIKPFTMPAAAGRETIFAPFTKMRAYGKGFQKGSVDFVKDITDSIKLKEWIDTNPTKGQMELGNQRTFNYRGENAVLKKLSTIGDTTDQIIKRMITDRPHYQAAYEMRLAELKKIHKGKLPKGADDMAKLYALDKVYQNNSMISKKMGELRRLHPAFDLIIPFTQTPANIFDKVLSYTPVETIRIVKTLGNAKSGKFNQKQFVDSLSRMMSGIGIFAFGMALHKKGILFGKMDDNKKAREFQKARGQNYYTLKIGDNYYGYDWATPVGNILAAAANYSKAAEKDKTTAEKLETLFTTSVDTVTSQSMLQGIMRMMGQYSLGAGVLESYGGATSQINPSIVKKFTKGNDEFERETSLGSIPGNAVRRFMSGVPGLRKQLEPKIDIFGENVKTKGIIKDMLPTKITTESKDPTIKEIAKIYDETKDKDVLPMPANVSKVSVKEYGETYSYELKTDKEKTEWKRMLGQAQKKAADEVYNSGYLDGLSDEDKIAEFKNAYSEAKKEAIYEFLENKGVL